MLISLLMTVVTVSLTTQHIETWRAQITTLYRDAFSPPPYRKAEAEISDFDQSLPAHIAREGFHFVGALDNHQEQLVGFAYGYTSTAGQWWYEHVKQALPMLAASHWLENSFQLVEIAVDPKAQGQGIGGRLHDHLLGGRPQARAVLSTLQAATRAEHLYRTRGWLILCEDFYFPGVDRPYQIMGLEPLKSIAA